MRFQLGRVGLFHLLLSIALPKTDGKHEPWWKKKRATPSWQVIKDWEANQRAWEQAKRNRDRAKNPPPPPTTTPSPRTTPVWKGEYSPTQVWLICPQPGYGKPAYFKDCNSGFCELGCTQDRTKFVSLVIFELLVHSFFEWLGRSRESQILISFHHRHRHIARLLQLKPLGCGGN